MSQESSETSTDSKPAALAIIANALPPTQAASAYSATLAAIGGIAPYTWGLTAGGLPVGLSLSATGVISGTTVQVGHYTFTAGVNDSSSPPETASQSFNLTVSVAAQLMISTLSLPSGEVGTPYSQTLNATGGTMPYTWSLASGTLPTGLTLNPSTGVISGISISVGNGNPLTFQVIDSTKPTAQTEAGSFTIAITRGIGHCVLLKWDASLSSAASGYNVYRSNTSGTGYSKINLAPVSGQTYTDQTVTSGETYYYVTTAVDSSGDESSFSNEIQESIP